MKRHNGRILAVMALYNMDVSSLNPEETMNSFNEILEMELNEEYPVEFDEKYARKLISGVCENLPIIDDKISANLVNYTLDRLSYVDRAIIRVATYEMMCLGLPKTVAINEAIEITKEYSSLDDKQAKFNNKVLATIADNI